MRAQFVDRIVGVIKLMRARSLMSAHMQANHTLAMWLGRIFCMQTSVDHDHNHVQPRTRDKNIHAELEARLPVKQNRNVIKRK